MHTISVISFGGGFNLPLWAAQHLQLFERHGTAIELHFTADSKQVFRGLMQGEYHVAITALDNIVAHGEGHADPVSNEPADFVAFMGSDEGFLSLVGAPGVADVAALAGRTVSVDDPANGFSMLLREMLSRHGLAPEAVQWDRAGGTDRRYEALLEGRHAATMLRTPFELLAAERGCRVLARTRDTVGPYMGIVGASRRSWANMHGDALVGFVRAWRDAVAWLLDPAHRLAAQALLQAQVPGMSPALAASACDVLLDAENGFFRDLRLDPEGVRCVLDLRSRWRSPAQVLDDPARYLDERWWRLATGRK